MTASSFSKADRHGLKGADDFSCTCGRRYDSASGLLTHWWMMEDDESPRMKKPKDLAADEDREWEILHRAIERKPDIR